MHVNLFHLHELDAATRTRLLRRAEAEIGDAEAAVQPIIARVRTEGDAALFAYAKQFDKAELKALRVTLEEFAHARASLSNETKAAIEFCAGNVRKFHTLQWQRLNQNWLMEIMPGVFAGEQISPIPSVGLYVPRGKGSFPSVMYMLGLPATVVGVPRVVACTPPAADGRADAATLFAAEISGVTEVYKVGGAQAIAALAYGTQSVPKVDKVLGPGNAYVAAAKRALANVIDPGMPAGPTDALILADASAHPGNTALDLLNEAEHGADSAALLVTECEELARKVAARVPEIIAQLREPWRAHCTAVMQNYGGIIITRSLDEAVDFCNEYGAEHLLIKTRNAEQLAPRLTTAGEILFGEHSPFSAGNFGIGVNNVLPTGSHARTWSATTCRDFTRVTTLSKCDAQGFASLREPVAKLAEHEGFDVHVRAMRERIV